MTKRKGRAAFGKLLSEINAQLRMTQLDLARRLGVSSRTVGRWKLGHWFPPPARRIAILHGLRDVVTSEQLDALAMALGVPVGTIQAGTPRSSAVDPALAKLALDGAMFEAAKRLDASARGVRDALLLVIARMAELGIDAPTAHALLRA